MVTGPSGPVTEKSTGPDEKSLVQIFKFKYFQFLAELFSSILFKWKEANKKSHENETI